jgi:3-oxoacyl-[acyl-carrier protein] reductase
VADPVRRALVTGGGRGIGRGIAQTLGSRNVSIALTYRRDRGAADEVVAGLREQGTDAVSLELDLADPTGFQRVVDEAASALGGLDILVNNAGSASSGRTVRDTDTAELTKVLGVHAIGPHQLSRAALPYLRQHERSDVIFVSSIASQATVAGGAPYSMGKAAVEALASTLAREERGNGVHVNVVAPGLVNTEMGRRLVRATLGVHDIGELDQSSPFGRTCTPEDVAGVVSFLLSTDSSYLTDQRIVIDGGTFR